MVWKVWRAMMWVVKGVLLVIAMGALFVWPWSYWHSGRKAGWRWIVGSERVDAIELGGRMAVGRVGIGLLSASFTKESLDLARRRAAPARPGWTWELTQEHGWWDYVPVTSYWGPFRWSFGQTNDK